MNADNIIKALSLATSLITQGVTLYNQAAGLIERAKREGRDVTDDELDSLAVQRRSAIDTFRAKLDT